MRASRQQTSWAAETLRNLWLATFGWISPLVKNREVTRISSQGWRNCQKIFGFCGSQSAICRIVKARARFTWSTETIKNHMAGCLTAGLIHLQKRGRARPRAWATGIPEKSLRFGYHSAGLVHLHMARSGGALLPPRRLTISNLRFCPFLRLRLVNLNYLRD